MITVTNEKLLSEYRATDRTYATGVKLSATLKSSIISCHSTAEAYNYAYALIYFTGYILRNILNTANTACFPPVDVKFGS